MKKSLVMYVSLAVLMFVATGCYEVVYQVDTKGSCIKFEDAMYDQDPDELLEDWVDACLGDDEVVQTDYLGVVVDQEVAGVLVSLKAGKDKATDVDVPTDGTPTAVGSFMVSVYLDDVVDDEYMYGIEVTCDDIPGGRGGTAALSNITICFGEAEILAPEEGEPFPTIRDTELEEPGEPEEIDEDQPN